MDSLNDWRRTHYTTDVGPEADGTEVIIFGWIEDIKHLDNKKGGLSPRSICDRSQGLDTEDGKGSPRCRDSSSRDQGFFKCDSSLAF
jgi:hypothetical protein